jgi:hypothetical protein
MHITLFVYRNPSTKVQATKDFIYYLFEHEESGIVYNGAIQGRGIPRRYLLMKHLN